jgi:choline dehydrogenase
VFRLFTALLCVEKTRLAWVAWMQGADGGGQRSSSATSYLTPAVLGRRNLHVAVNTRVTRIQRSNTSSSDGPEFDNVEAFGNGEFPDFSKKRLVLFCLH